MAYLQQERLALRALLAQARQEQALPALGQLVLVPLVQALLGQGQLEQPGQGHLELRFDLADQPAERRLLALVGRHLDHQVASLPMEVVHDLALVPVERHRLALAELVAYRRSHQAASLDCRRDSTATQQFSRHPS